MNVTHVSIQISLCDAKDGIGGRTSYGGVAATRFL